LGYTVSRVVGGDRPALAIPGHRCDPTADAQLLFALARSAGASRSASGVSTPAEDSTATVMHLLAGRVASWVTKDGSVRPEGVTPSRSDPDVLAGVALLALATYCRATCRDLAVDWARSLAWYRNRFELLHPWELATWHCQVWPVVSHLTGDARFGQLSLDCADWMCGLQMEADGSFLSEASENGGGAPGGASSQVARIARGVATSWGWAASVGDEGRCRRYRDSWTRAMRFLDRLLVRADDTYWMPDPGVAIGAIRTSQACYELRADSTSDALAAVMAGTDALGAP
jgi:hypothetical protein